jgi:hypothetical protein
MQAEHPAVTTDDVTEVQMVAAAAATTPEAAGDEDKKALTARLVAAEQQHSDDARTVQALQVCALFFALPICDDNAAALRCSALCSAPRRPIACAMCLSMRTASCRSLARCRYTAALRRPVPPRHCAYSHTHIHTYTHTRTYICVCFQAQLASKDKDLVSARDELRLADRGIVCSVMGNMLIALEVAPTKVRVCSHRCRCLPLYQP